MSKHFDFQQRGFYYQLVEAKDKKDLEEKLLTFQETLFSPVYHAKTDQQKFEQGDFLAVLKYNQAAAYNFPEETNKYKNVKKNNSDGKLVIDQEPCGKFAVIQKEAVDVAIKLGILLCPESLDNILEYASLCHPLQQPRNIIVQAIFYNLKAENFDFVTKLIKEFGPHLFQTIKGIKCESGVIQSLRIQPSEDLTQNLLIGSIASTMNLNVSKGCSLYMDAVMQHDEKKMSFMFDFLNSKSIDSILKSIQELSDDHKNFAAPIIQNLIIEREKAERTVFGRLAAVSQQKFAISISPPNVIESTESLVGKVESPQASFVETIELPRAEIPTKYLEQNVPVSFADREREHSPTPPRTKTHVDELEEIRSKKCSPCVIL